MIESSFFRVDSGREGARVFKKLFIFRKLNVFDPRGKNKVGKPTSTPLPLNLEGIEHFARRRNTAKR